MSLLKAEKLTRKQRKILSILSLDVLLESLPGVVISVNRMLGNLAVVESTAMHIPVVGLVDSNVSSGYNMYPILSNDDSYKVVFFFVLFFSKIILVTKMTRFLKFKNFYATTFIFKRAARIKMNKIKRRRGKFPKRNMEHFKTLISRNNVTFGMSQSEIKDLEKRKIYVQK